MRFFIIVSLLWLANFYVVWRAAAYFSPLKSHFSSIIIISLILFIIQSAGLLTRSSFISYLIQDNRLQDLESKIHLISYTIFGILSCLLIYIFTADLLKMILNLMVPHSSAIYVYFNKFAFPTVIIFTLCTAVLGIKQALNGPSVRKVEIFIENLPKSFNGFKIVQITDLHVGSTIKYDYVNKVVKISGELKPDIIALTGDFVDGQVTALKNDVAPLSHLKATYGTFFVTGNHEYYSGAQAWIEEFKKLGIKVLSNEHVIIRHNNDEIILAGVTDYSTRNNTGDNPSSPIRAAEGAPPNLVKILLAHQPSSYIEATKAGFDLQLSGHTHAGQYFPFTFLIRFFHRYYEGLNRHEKMQIFIGRGSGYWGPPFRLGAPAEVSLITLRSRPN